MVRRAKAARLATAGPIRDRRRAMLDGGDIHSTCPVRALVDDAPAGNVSVTDAPMGNVPVGDAPVSDAPVGNVPVGDVPVGNVPAGVIGHTVLSVAGGAKHQGPPGGGPVAIIACSTVLGA
ncbi:MAG: hypothetical protein JSR91_00960 [Proteobacteria bacterium]|nr:hypothetical protein [Pseudomonadota bacterium]